MSGPAPSAAWWVGGALAAAALILGTVLGTAWWADQRLQTPAPSDPTQSTGTAITREQQLKLEREIEQFCASCHVSPPAGSFPQDAWYEEVRQGFQFARAKGYDISRSPPFNEVVRYFARRAPAQLRYMPERESDPNPSVRFVPSSAALDGKQPAPGVAHIIAARLSSSENRVLIVCDMRQGLVLSYDLARPEQGLSIRARVPHPAHAEPVDLDGDGRIDLLVADLGSLLPGNHTNGQVLWLRRVEGSSEYEPILLAGGLGRVADARGGDFDGDGDIDLVVAVFGWRTVGELLYLENRTEDWSRPRFEPRTLERKTGSIHVPIADLNGDGSLDFVALFSQEHEQIVAYLNDGTGNFRPERIFTATDPAYGSTGIQLVDLDGDTDLDVLYTNGDSMDSMRIKPYHSVQWLENRGEFPFRYHHLATMPGVHRALASDLDGDGDMDVAASAFLPNAQFSERDSLKLTSLLWLENRAGDFFRHSLETVHCDHAALEIADCDGDGRPELILGNFSGDGIHAPLRLPPMRDWIRIWHNRPGGE